MKLIIDIPEDVYNDMIKLVKVDGDIDRLVDVAIVNGTPLEKHDEEVIKETVESVWGKPPYNDVFDKIRAEIQNLRDCSCSCSDGIIDDVEEILDKYRQSRRLKHALEIIDKYRESEG